MQLRLDEHIIALLLNLAVRNGHFVGKILLTFFFKLHLNDNIRVHELLTEEF